MELSLPDMRELGPGITHIRNLISIFLTAGILFACKEFTSREIRFVWDNNAAYAPASLNHVHRGDIEAV